LPLHEVVFQQDGPIGLTPANVTKTERRRVQFATFDLVAGDREAVRQASVSTCSPGTV
jgi:hypothetical protein